MRQVTSSARVNKRAYSREGNKKTETAMIYLFVAVVILQFGSLQLGDFALANRSPIR